MLCATNIDNLLNQKFARAATAARSANIGYFFDRFESVLRDDALDGFFGNAEARANQSLFAGKFFQTARAEIGERRLQRGGAEFQTMTARRRKQTEFAFDFRAPEIRIRAVQIR